MSNRERILEAAKALFNQYGPLNVGTNKIADYLQISPGNLYYHFQNREEIIRTIFLEISDAADRAVQVGTPGRGSMADLGDVLLNSVQVVWHYRFFYGNLVQLLRNDPKLKALYLQRRETSLAFLEAVLRDWLQNRHDRDGLSETDLKILATNVWIVAVNWIGFLQIEKEDNQITRPDLLRGAFQILEIMKPYLDQETIRLVHDRLHTRLQELEQNSRFGNTG
ncbi:TetR/AcrR family transcriptional regulator [Sneathiella chinensis]|uniref:TetR family transcriptional regulator n=1 Tax=Sneathiella chinensis TaxID=349750 RepID=A0ABQ5U2W2_9PROT|nr:TetR/AcrR family transcriptional regulator [Sneathiella chinensis]GLQ05583.1 TetR family transcriptional regulator [Sneathiella chinensis]